MLGNEDLDQSVKHKTFHLVKPSAGRQFLKCWFSVIDIRSDLLMKTPLIEELFLPSKLSACQLRSIWYLLNI